MLQQRAEALAQPIHLRAKCVGTRATARPMGATTSIRLSPGLHDIDTMQWSVHSPITQLMARKVERLGTGNEDALSARTGGPVEVDRSLTG